MEALHGETWCACCRAATTGGSYDNGTKESGELLTIGARGPHSIAIAPEFPEGNHRMRRVPCI